MKAFLFSLLLFAISCKCDETNEAFVIGKFITSTRYGHPHYYLIFRYKHDGSINQWRIQPDRYFNVDTGCVINVGCIDK